jgi:hypothetical protein
MTVDESKLNAFLGQFVQDVGATVQAGMVVLATGSACTGPWPGPGR